MAEKSSSPTPRTVTICCAPGMLVLTARFGTRVARSVAVVARVSFSSLVGRAVTLTPTLRMFSSVRSAVTTTASTWVAWLAEAGASAAMARAPGQKRRRDAGQKHGAQPVGVDE